MTGPAAVGAPPVVAACAIRIAPSIMSAAQTTCSRPETRRMTVKDGTPAGDAPSPTQAAGRPPAPIPYVRAMDPRYGEAVEVAPGLRRLTCRNPGPFTYLGTNSFIVGRGEVAVVDPGPRDDAHLAALLRAVEGERVAAVLVTHTHADHSPLARPFAEAAGGAPVYGLPDPGADGGEGAGDPAFRPDVALADGEVVAGEGWALEAVSTPGHASNHMAYAVDGDALLCGDHVMGWSTTIVSPPDGDMDAYLSSLDRVIARRFRTLHPAHGSPVTDPGPFLDAYRAHRLQREAQVLAAVRSGLARIPQMVAALYAEVDPRLHPAAARSVEAHLIRLARRGEVRVEAGLYAPAP